MSFVGFTACTPLWPGLQFHNQDGSGSYSYGYQGPHHAKMESRSNGITQGGSFPLNIYLYYSQYFIFSPEVTIIYAPQKD